MNMLTHFYGNLPLDFNISHAQVNQSIKSINFKSINLILIEGEILVEWHARLKVRVHQNIHYVLTIDTFLLWKSGDMSMPNF